MKNGSKITENCRYDERRPCVCACPVNFDVDSFLKKLKSGNVKSAGRVLANGLVFPAIVTRLCDAPCREVCPDGIDLHRLEVSCAELAGSKPVRYSLPRQEKRIAVIGAGLSGMALAWKLASKNYRVTVYDRGEVPGGTLLSLFGEDFCLQEFSRCFGHLSYTFCAKTGLSSLDPVKDYDAIYISTGAGGNDFGSKDHWNSRSKASEKNGIFLGGELVSDGKMNALADAITAAASIEYYLQTGSMAGESSKFMDHHCKLPADSFVSDPAVSKKEDGGSDLLLSKERLREEASRCRMCNCTFCTEGCEFLKWYKLGPKKLEESMKNAQAKSTGLCDRQGTRAAFSCELCGHCKTVCPESIGFEDLMLETKQKLFENGFFPEVLHEFFTEDMKEAMSEDFLLCPLNSPADNENTDHKTKYLFFPGCQEAKSAPDHVLKACRYLSEKLPDVSVMLACCGVPALWAGNRPLFQKTLDQLRQYWQEAGRPVWITACPTCLKTLRRYLPEISAVSIYEIIEKFGLPDQTSHNDLSTGHSGGPSNSVYIFHPCSSAGFDDQQQAVRRIAGLLGYKESPDVPLDPKARCCGMGGHVYPTNRAVALSTLKSAAGLSEDPYLCYCANCRDLFLKAGKECRHILDDVFGTMPPVKAPHLSTAKAGRKALKRELLMNYFPEERSSLDEPGTASGYSFVFDEALLDKMDQELIAQDKIEELIMECEASGKKLYDPGKGSCIAYRQIGKVTYWTEYSLGSGKTVYVLNAYCHRIRILESTVK